MGIRPIPVDRMSAPAQVRSTRRVLRSGVTLLELLVVLVLMAITASLVLPALSATTLRTSLDDLPDETRDMSGDARATSLMPRDAVVDPIVTEARRHAITRGEPLHLRMAGDGVWTLAPIKSGAAVDGGRATLPLAWLPDVYVDAIGTCTLAAQAQAPSQALSWDALACRWRGLPAEIDVPLGGAKP